jgi:hypothetical protein
MIMMNSTFPANRGMHQWLPAAMRLYYSGPTAAELEELGQIAREAEELRYSPEQVVDAIKTRVPSLSGLADLLPKNAVDLCAYLTAIGTVVLIVQGAMKEQPSVTIKQNITINFPQQTQPPAQPEVDQRLIEMHSCLRSPAGCEPDTYQHPDTPS